MKKISVIIPVYNVEKFLPQCLSSIVHQTYKNLEIIIVDDGSPDNSEQIYTYYANNDKRIKVIKQKNAGISVARNTGIKHATGDYIHFIDSDDYIDLDYYEKMISAIQNTNPDIIAGGVISQNGKSYSIQYKTRTILTTLSEKFLITNALLNCTVWRYLFRRKFLLDNNLKFPDNKIFEDILFTPDAIRLANYIITVPDTNYHYVFNKNSILNKKYSQNHEQQYIFAEQVRDKFIQTYNLEDIYSFNKRTDISTYKIIAFKIFKTILNHETNEKKYYLFGIRIMKRYIKQPPF